MALAVILRYGNKSNASAFDPDIDIGIDGETPHISHLTPQPTGESRCPHTRKRAVCTKKNCYQVFGKANLWISDKPVLEKMATVRDIIGLIPAAGTAQRLGDLSQSKEILPVVFGPERAGVAAFAKPACHHLLEGFRSAGVTKALMVLRTGKWDIPASLAQNPVQGVDLSYIVIEESAGVPWTLDRAYPFVSGSDVVMGFPDILIRPTTLYRQMVEELRAGRSDVVLGVMPTSNPSKVDVVEIADDGKVDCIRPKPEGLSTARAWIVAAWRPSFTEYMHDFLVDNPVGSAIERELYLGDILAASLTELEVFAVVCDEGRFIDIGTPEDLADVRVDS